jgi:hypothetical protein
MSTKVSWGLEGPSIVMLRTSFEKALGLLSEELVRPIASIATNIMSGRSEKSVMASSNLSSVAHSAAGRDASGITLIVRVSVTERRRMISVAKRVQRLSFLGKGISVRASRTDDFPAD